MLDYSWPKPQVIILVLLVPFLFLLNGFVHRPAHSQASNAAQPANSSKAPSQQGAYVTNELDFFAHRYLRRVAGRDTNLSAGLNGHDEFAAKWVAEMRSNLHGLPVGVFKQYLRVPGFRGHPAKRPGENVVVFVPGSVHPGEAVVIGSHYDGEPDSRGSAFDDTSGSAITLGVANTLAADWRQHGLPQMTIEFCLFDAEEQGLIGSGSYLYDFRHAAIMPHPVMMIDEEQSGVGYPARPFGLASKAVMPSFAITTSLGALERKLFKPVIHPKPAALKLMISRLNSDRASAFSDLSAVYPSLVLAGGTVHPFRKSEESNLVVGPTPVCCSDNAPFEALGLPTVTFSGDFQFYNPGHPSWAYPYDQPSDTPVALACDTGGSTTSSQSLQAALGLTVDMSYRVVSQYSPSAAGAKTVAVMSSRVVAGRDSEFVAAGPGPITWNFGDGGTARGSTVLHRYRHPGRFTIKLHSPGLTTSGPVKVERAISEPKLWTNLPVPPAVRPWHPSELKHVAGCP